MFSAGQKPWHGQGTVVEGALTSKEAIKAAGLDWQVEKRANFYKKTVGKAEVMEQGLKFQVVRTDTQDSLGVVGPVWQPHQNRQAFADMDEIVGRKEAMYETAGALGGGERIWLLAKVKGLITLKGVDEIEKYLLLANSHDGSTAIKLATTTVRPVCGNTLNLALKEAESMGEVFSIRHTKNAGKKINQAMEFLGIAQKQFADFADLAGRLTEIKINTKAMDEFLDNMGFDVEATKGRAAGIVEEIKDAFVSSPGSKLVSAKGTAWGLLNAVTFYADHVKATRLTKDSSFKNESEARLNSSWFGSGDVMKRKALKVITETLVK